MSIGELSKARLGRVHDVMSGYVERGDVPGVATLISRRGEVYADALGMQAIEGSTPLQRDTIFRISSMTQRVWASPNPPNICLDFWTSAYQAIDD